MSTENFDNRLRNLFSQYEAKVGKDDWERMNWYLQAQRGKRWWRFLSSGLMLAFTVPFCFLFTAGTNDMRSALICPNMHVSENYIKLSGDTVDNGTSQNIAALQAKGILKVDEITENPVPFGDQKRKPIRGKIRYQESEEEARNFRLKAILVVEWSDSTSSKDSSELKEILSDSIPGNLIDSTIRR